MSGLRLTVLGGGGFRVPLVYRALCAEDSDGARVDEVVLHDVSADRLRLMRSVLSHVESGGGGAGGAPRGGGAPPDRCSAAGSTRTS
jgi:6-phospho-beta-glucosidase